MCNFLQISNSPCSAMECMDLGLDDSPECARIFGDCDSDPALLQDWAYSDLIAVPSSEAGLQQCTSMQVAPLSPGGSSQFDSASPSSDCSSSYLFCSQNPISPLPSAAAHASAGESPALSSSGEEERADDDAPKGKKPIKMPQSKF